MIRGLDACETYHVAVMVGEPIGIGPVVEKAVSILFVPLKYFSFILHLMHLYSYNIIFHRCYEAQVGQSIS